MELKKYQQDVLADIDLYNEHLNKTGDLRTAYQSYWESKGVSLVENDDYLHDYYNSVPGVPRVTLKVPTAGGKTFIACNAIRNIMDSMPTGTPQVVVWFVPSDAILKQTFHRLSDANDPYRQRIDTLFNSRVKVYDKESLLAGNEFDPAVVKEQLSILVLSINSFATNIKDGRLSYRENENLTGFPATYNNRTHKVEGADETALIQVIASLNPVVIIDESHNFKADLRVETLREINPRYILELTATPRKHISNVISFIDAHKLKSENMVKLPVIVYNHEKVDDVISSAIQLRHNLELQAKQAEQQGGDYIRPIVLFQAQPKTGDDTTTFDKVKQQLIEIGIPEAQIKIKTAEKDELKNIDLMSPQCEVRFIITVDALKEGWDCPFAYILASLANRTSRISVEQILGRILRQPYTRQHSVDFLNMSYVFTSSADFKNTLDLIVKSLNDSGFSGKDCYVADNEKQDETSPQQSPQIPFPQQETEPEDAIEETMDDGGVDDVVAANLDSLKAVWNNVSTSQYSPAVDSILTKAASEGQKYHTASSNASHEKKSLPSDLSDKLTDYGMKADFAEIAKAMILPKFHVKVKGNVFVADNEIPLTDRHLTEGFNLETCDKNISFESTSSDAVMIDLEKRNSDEYVPKSFALDEQKLKVFGAFIKGLNNEDKVAHLALSITNSIENSLDAIGHRQILSYVESVLRMQEPYKLDELAVNFVVTKETFKKKIKREALKHRRMMFNKMLAAGKIIIKDNFVLRDRIVPKNGPRDIPKSLYTEETGMNDTEYKVIKAIANLENVLFWHRNFENGTGFCINGFINHYPDFIVMLKSGQVLLIEVKGDFLDGSDSADKLDLGNKWAEKAGNKYSYFMVFDEKDINSTSTLADVLQIIRGME